MFVLPESLWIQLICHTYFPGFVAICAVFAMSFGATFLILRFLNNEDENIMHRDLFVVTRSITTKSQPEIPKGKSAAKGGGSSILSDIQLPFILNDGVLYDLFMYHLMSEFSMECLLAFTEFEQYRLKCHDVFGLDVQTTGDMRNVILAENIPKSAIVYDGDGSRDNDENVSIFKLKAYRLFRKYIAIGSEFEINISYSARRELINLMNDHDKWLNEAIQIDLNDLSNLFASCCDQIYGLLNDSVVRFKTTAAFSKYMDHRQKRMKSVSVMTLSVNNNNDGAPSPISPQDSADAPTRESIRLSLSAWKG